MTFGVAVFLILFIMSAFGGIAALLLGGVISFVFGVSGDTAIGAMMLIIFCITTAAVIGLWIHDNRR